MGKREVQCQHCEHAFEIDDLLAVDSITCPSCGAFTLIRESEDNGAPRARLALKEEDLAVTANIKRCPVCDGSADAQAVLCVQCGYDWRTGRRRGQFLAGRMPSSKTVLAGAVVVLALLAIYFYLQSRSTVPPATPAAEPPPPAAATDVPVVEEGAEGPMSAEQEATTEEDAMLDEAVTDSETDDADLEKLEERTRARFTEQMDERSPMFEKDGEAAFRKNNGIVYRGMFLGVKKDVAVLMRDGGSLEIPLDDLDRPTRIRCDKEYRERYIEFRVRRHMHKMKKR